jgi:hypothetical protein
MPLFLLKGEISFPQFGQVSVARYAISYQNSSLLITRITTTHTFRLSIAVPAEIGEFRFIMTALRHDARTFQ